MSKIMFLPSGFKVEIGSGDVPTDFIEHPYTYIFESLFDSSNEVRLLGFSYLKKIGEVLLENIKYDGKIELSRQAPKISKKQVKELSRQVPFILGAEYVNSDWIIGIYNKLGEIFETELDKYADTVAAYLSHKNSDLLTSSRIYFHLAENKSEDYSFVFLATYASKVKGRVKHLPLNHALEEYKETQDRLILLKSISDIAKESIFLSEFVESGELFHPLALNKVEAYQFLKEVKLYEKLGITCRIPDFWKRNNRRKVSITIGEKKESLVGFDALMSCYPEIYIQDEVFSRDEIEELLKETEGLAFIKGKWIEVNHEKLQQLLTTYEMNLSKEVTFLEALQLNNQSSNDNNNVEVEIGRGDWLDEFRNKLLTPTNISRKEVTNSFKAVLRPYQEIGFSWLDFMQENQLGGLLADDMGLGKTVQVLALVNQLTINNKKTLLVLPASLIENWKKEATTFTPMIVIQELTNKKDRIDLAEGDLFITTYGMVSKIEGLLDTIFDLVVLDEAQAIKNVKTQQTKYVKKIKAKTKLALTGTPVENNVADIWSIFDFINPGLLGNQKEFAKFVKNTNDYSKVRNLINPFILRRLKTDKNIISDLPEKMENKEYIQLTAKQVALYKQLQNSVKDSLAVSEGIKKRGIILASITKFKQICNHPAQYLGNQDFVTSQSGKFQRLQTICETIKDKREKVLIFTQFQEICEPLNEFLFQIFGKEGLVLHGGTPVKKRGGMVSKFNQDDEVSYMILSLKAGGVGLNLTGANHVIHFDRWWNPAVENQATDRAFRIGQQKNVMVYKMIASGTIEEKIDEMLQMKSKLSNDIIEESSGEKWLTSLTDDDLERLFTLEEGN